MSFFYWLSFFVVRYLKTMLLLEKLLTFCS